MEGSSPRDGWVRELGDMSMHWGAGRQSRALGPSRRPRGWPGALEDTSDHEDRLGLRGGAAMAGANKPQG